MSWKSYGIAALVLASAGIVVAFTAMGGDVSPASVERDDLGSPEEPHPPQDGEPSRELPANPAPRSGLHFTPQELEIWRQRALHGPFRTDSGPPHHYPGDWDRIRRNAADFIIDPRQARWPGPEHNNPGGCVLVDPDYPSSNPPGDASIRLRDAAFYYLVEQHAPYRDAVKNELLWLTQQPGLDFSNRERWCTGILWDLPPSWDTAIWLSRLLYAYDYLGPESFTDAERQRVNEWFYHAADYWQRDNNVANDSLFVDRWNGDFALTDADCDSTEIGYYGSKPICTLAMFYNNRKAHVFRFVTSAGIKLEMEEFSPPGGASPGADLADLQESGKLFAQEWLMFSVYPEGFFGEFERWTAENPILGWAYGAGVLSPVVTIADELARSGDRSVIDFTTRDGALGTASGGGMDWAAGQTTAGEGLMKSLQFAIESYARYVDGSFVRYGTDNPHHLTDEYRIRSYHDSTGYRTNVDAGVMMANMYYQSDYIRSMYLRTGHGMPPYPELPADDGMHGWMGNGRVYPGVLFMFGGLEGMVWPYESAAPQIPSSPGARL